MGKGMEKETGGTEKGLEGKERGGEGRGRRDGREGMPSKAEERGNMDKCDFLNFLGLEYYVHILGIVRNMFTICIICFFFWTPFDRTKKIAYVR